MKKSVITKAYMQSQIENKRCPEPSYCALNTTGCDRQKRIERCTRCWTDWCEENNIEIVEE